MSKSTDHNILCYLASMEVIEQWLQRGLIDDVQYKQIDTILGEKFCIPVSSVWRSINLLSVGR